jgi:hypothetical protein
MSKKIRRNILFVTLSYSHQKIKIYSSKGDKPLFLNQTRIGIAESIKSTYPFFLLQSYLPEVIVPNLVQEHNINVFFVAH